MSTIASRRPTSEPGRTPVHGRRRGRTGPAPSHTLPEVLAAASAIADRDGFQAVSIRRVAAELGTAPMNLYTHVSGKHDLVALMVDDLLGQAVDGDPPAGWRGALAAQSRAFHAVLVEHGWLIEALGTRPRLGLNSVRRAKLLLQAVAELDIADADVWNVVGVVDDYVLGHALRAGTAVLSDRVEALVTAEDLEALPQLRMIARARRERDTEADFERGLQTVLGGVARRLGVE